MNSLFIKPGDTIGVMAPSSFVEKDDIEKSKALLEARGYTVVVHPQTFARHNQSAGTQDEKLAALHALYADKTVKAIWAAGGGNRALYLLDGLDAKLIGKNPKPLIGFSDTTALLNAVAARSGQAGWHAQVFKNLHKGSYLEQTMPVIEGKNTALNLKDAKVLIPGKAAGKLVGGCLSLFHALPGTKDCPKLKGAILFLEDTGDEISRLDRMFAQMKRLGVFKEIGALVLGQFLDVHDSGRPFGFTLEDIVTEALAGRHIPVITGAAFGHGAALFPLPVGTTAALDTGAGSLRLGGA
ncbi:MAG: LD-carboxypeptidase [Magnetococcus sp. WYHC-3]